MTSSYFPTIPAASSLNPYSPGTHTQPVASRATATDARQTHLPSLFAHLPSSTAPPHPPAPLQNGRVRVRPDASATPYTFSLTDARSAQADAQTPAVANLASMQQETVLSRVYFSGANTQIIQNAIRKQVHDATAIIVKEQDIEQIQLVMRSVFLQYSRNQTDSAAVIREQIVELNAKVVAFCVPEVVSSLKQYQHYLKDVSTLPVPLEHSQHTSMAGTRSLEYQPFL